MIYGFINDTAAWLRAVGMAEVVDFNQGAMFLDEQAINYFNVPGKIGDTRSQRLTVAVDNPSPVSGVPNGHLQLLFDKDQMDGHSFANVEKEEFDQLFNIIELCFTSQGRTSAWLNATMASDTSYGVYLAGSLAIAPTYVTLGNYYLVGGGVASPQIRSWITFHCVLSGQTVEFKIWSQLSQFEADYPICTMTKVIYPCDPSLILSLNDQENVAKMLQESSQSMITSNATEVKADDHTGIYSFKCKYNNSIFGIGRYSFYFGVFYKGRQPSREEARQFIKDNLIADTNTDDSMWIDVLPDLFSKASFLMVPIWSNYAVNASNETIKSAIYDAEVFVKALGLTYPSYNSANLVAYAEVIYVASSDVFLAVLPNPDNDASVRSIKQIHPTYMGLATASAGFNKQSVITQQFSEQLNDTMGLLHAAGGGNVIDSDDVLGRRHLSFSVNSIDYHVLIKADYPSGV